MATPNHAPVAELDESALAAQAVDQAGTLVPEAAPHQKAEVALTLIAMREHVTVAGREAVIPRLRSERRAS